MNMVHAHLSTWLNWRLAALLALTLAALVFAPSVAQSQSPPNTPSAVTVTRADGTLTASGYAVSGATKYHITYSADGGGSWSLAALNHTGNSITIGVANAKTYIVGVRAGNDSGWSGWRNSAAAGPYTPPQPTPTPTPAPQPPGAVASVSLTRADGTVTASWNAVSGATFYHVTYTTDNGQSWSLAASQHSGSSITVSSADNAKTYIVGVRAGNASGWSGWVNSAAAGPYTPPASPPDAPTSVTATRSDGAMTASWPAVAGASGYTVTYSAVGDGSWITAASDHARTSITISGVNNDYTYIVGASANNGAGSSSQTVSPASGPNSQKLPLAPTSVTVLREDGKLTAFWSSSYSATDYHVTYSSDYGKNWTLAASNHPVGNGITEITIDGLDNAKHYTVGVRARNKNGYSGWRNSAPSGPYVPIAAPPEPRNAQAYPGNGSAVFIWDKPGGFNGDGKVTGYQAAYWLNPGADCIGPATIKWQDIPGSDGDTVYHTIIGHHIENGELKTGLKNGIRYGVALRALNQHVPGPVVGFCLTPFAGASPPPFVPPAPKSLNLIRGDGTLTVTWHHARTALGYQVDYSTNGGQSWAMAVWWNNTTSTILRGMDNNTAYTVRVRGRNNRGDGPWSESVTDTPPVSLSASGVGATKATLTLANYTGGAWHYQQHTSSSTGSCEGPVASGTTTKILTGLSNGKAYTYKAYSDSSCATEIDAASFTTLTPNLAVSNIARTSATLTLTGWTAGSGAGDDGVWYYKRDTSGGINAQSNSCSTAQSAGTADLTGLTVNTDYTYKAYTDSGCGTELVAADGFYTGDIVSNLGETKAYSGLVGNWWTSPNNYNVKRAGGFTTGSNSNGYTLEKVTAKFDTKVGSPTGFTAAIHAASSGSPAATATCTLSGNVPDNAAEYAYTASSCSLSASTTYFLVLSASGTAGASHYYQWNYTASTSQSSTPSNTGWTFADKGKVKTSNNNWSDDTAVPLFEVKAAVKQAVSVSSLGNSRNGYTTVGNNAGNKVKAAAQFTVGANTGGYELSSVTVKIDQSASIIGTPGDLTVAIYSNGTTNTPTVKLITLSGSNPTGAGEYTYTCSSSCDLPAGYTRQLVLEAPNASGTNSYYGWENSNSGSEVAVPSGNGWSIGKSSEHSSGTWSDITPYLKFKVTAMPK